MGVGDLGRESARIGSWAGRAGPIEIRGAGCRPTFFCWFQWCGSSRLPPGAKVTPRPGLTSEQGPGMLGRAGLSGGCWGASGCS